MAAAIDWQVLVAAARGWCADAPSAAMDKRIPAKDVLRTMRT